jgi:hypothetical protein
MSALPLAAKVALAVVLAGSIGAAFFGPRPRRRRPLALRALAVAGLLLYAAAGVAVWAAGSVTAGALLVMAAVEVVCLAAWLARGRDDDRRWPPEEDEGPDEPDPPGGDFASFEAALRRWQRDRPRSPLAG